MQYEDGLNATLVHSIPPLGVLFQSMLPSTHVSCPVAPVSSLFCDSASLLHAASVERAWIRSWIVNLLRFAISLALNMYTFIPTYNPRTKIHSSQSHILTCRRLNSTHRVDGLATPLHSSLHVVRDFVRHELGFGRIRACLMTRRL